MWAFWGTPGTRAASDMAGAAAGGNAAGRSSHRDRELVSTPRGQQKPAGGTLNANQSPLNLVTPAHGFPKVAFGTPGWVRMERIERMTWKPLCFFRTRHPLWVCVGVTSVLSGYLERDRFSNVGSSQREVNGFIMTCKSAQVTASPRWKGLPVQGNLPADARVLSKSRLVSVCMPVRKGGPLPQGIARVMSRSSGGS